MKVDQFFGQFCCDIPLTSSFLPVLGPFKTSISEKKKKQIKFIRCFGSIPGFIAYINTRFDLILFFSAVHIKIIMLRLISETENSLVKI